MVVTFDNSAISTIQTNVPSGTAFGPAAVTTAPGACAIAYCCNTGSTWTRAGAVAAATFGGVAMIPLGSAAVNNVDPEIMWAFGLKNVAGGASQATSITLTQAGKNFTGWAAVFTYNNVGALGPLITNFGSSTAPQTVVPSAPGNMVWGAVFDTATNTFSAPTFTTRQGNNATTNQPAWIAGDQAGAVSSTCGATMSAGFTWGAFGVNLIAKVRPAIIQQAVPRASLY